MEYQYKTHGLSVVCATVEESGSRLEKVPRFSTIRMFDDFDGPMWRDQSSLRLATCKTLCDSSG